MTIQAVLTDFVKTEAYTRLFEDLRERYLKEFENSGASEHVKRQEAYVKLGALKDLRVQIERYVNDMKLNKRFNGDN